LGVVPVFINLWSSLSALQLFMRTVENILEIFLKKVIVEFKVTSSV
jgi:hypothetical protein